MKKIAIFFIAFSFICNNAFAEQNCQAAPEKFHVVFGNGILTTVEGARDSRDELKLNLGTSYAGQEIDYDLAYNYTNGAFIDLLQSFDQQLAQYTSQVLQWFYGIGIVPDWFNNLQQQILVTEYQINGPELTAHVEKYREAILQGQKVLVVSHSQGNFYVNQAKQILSSQQPSVPMGSFGIFGVATPANNVGGASSPYLTNHRDIILLVPGSLSSNWDLKNAVDGSLAEDRGRVLAHSFVDTYMSYDFDILPPIIEGVQLELGALQDPPFVVGSGPVTALMTWNLGNNDVDLHIYEPDGGHVYYRNLQGTSGFLDADNVTGFGPEHYFTDCNQLQVGEYIFGVNYYDDHADDGDRLPARPVTAAVTLTVPTATRTFTLTLNDDIQSAGDNSPTRVGKIIVEKIVDPGNPLRDGKLKYTIAP